jgi:hypothetical protein
MDHRGRTRRARLRVSCLGCTGGDAHCPEQAAHDAQETLRLGKIDAGAVRSALEDIRIRWCARLDGIGEPMLELSDPLWSKLDDAHRDRHIPTLLAELAASWDREAAKSLLWDCLCHQETCYGATYAAIPHLVKIADPEENRYQRLEIATFLGFVALCARDHHGQGRRRQLEDAVLQGLPETLEGWDRKLHCFRDLVAALERPDRRSRFVQTELLPRYRQVLAIAPVNADDLEKILSIKAEFFSALPSIRALCELSLLENVEDKEAVRFLLSGIAAADGLLSIARLLNYGDEGLLQCTSCSQDYEFIRFGEQIAIYARDPTPSAVRPADDKGLSDYKEGAPSRADGFVVPIAENNVLDARTASLLSLAKRAPSPEPALLLRHFVGSFVCGKCGIKVPMHSP